MSAIPYYPHLQTMIPQVTGYLPPNMLPGLSIQPPVSMGMPMPVISGYQPALLPYHRTALTPESECSTSSSSPPAVSGGVTCDLVNTIGQEEKNDDYLKELQDEKESLEMTSIESLSKTHTLKLLEQEMCRISSGGSRVCGREDIKYVDIYRERPIRLTVRALVPVREHPKFNFVGKLLGPKGNSMKRLQEETMTKMAVLGRGSMRDKAKEEELRSSADPKYQHLHEDLHVEITAFAPPAEAHARVAFALTEVRKYLIPDSNDEIRQEQMREMEMLTGGEQLLTLPQQQMLTVPLATPTTSLSGHVPTLENNIHSSPYLPPGSTMRSPTITGLPTKYLDETKPVDISNSSLVGQAIQQQKIHTGEVGSPLKVISSGERRKTVRQLATPYSRIP